ncbi:MAG: response regulator transcription factor [Nitrospirota bacterium]
MIKVLIADDHTMLRKGLKLILSEAEDIVVTAEASDGQEAIDRIDAEDFDVVILDISMPRKNGLEALREMKARGKNIPALILSTYSDEDYKQAAREMGAAGYLTKDEAPERLIAAIRDAAKNK